MVISREQFMPHLPSEDQLNAQNSKEQKTQPVLSEQTIVSAEEVKIHYCFLDIEQYITASRQMVISVISFLEK